MKIIKIENEKNIEKILLPAKEAIRKGNLVIIPTETVYGLAADCFNIEAVNKIFLVKNRPYSDPLIVHISSFSQLKKVVKYIPLEAKKIMINFWPGPVSLVLLKNQKLPDIVTAALNTVCVRMPENPITRKFIDMCGTPLAAPSANIFGRVSATDLSHILADFKDKKEIEYIIYTGRPKYGVESTVIDCTTYPFKVLRYGAVDIETIEKKCNLKIVENKTQSLKKSPGMFKKHYSPLKPTFLVKNMIKYIKKISEEDFQNTTFICSTNTKERIEKIFKDKNISIISYGKNFEEIMKNLYFCLRLADEFKTKCIVVEATEYKGLGKTIMDRLIKASENKWLDI